MAGLGEMMAAPVLRVDDINRASTFYKDVLGLTPGPDAPGPTPQAMFMAGAGTAVLLYERPGMPAPQNTTLSFAIPADKFDAVVAELRAKGVAFQDIDIPEIGLKSVDGVVGEGAQRAAFFNDPEGNIISIVVM